MSGDPTPDLGGSAARVQAAARDLGLAIRVVEMPASTRTAEEAAAACGCDVAAIVKSLVFKGASSGRPLLLLVSGANRVDEAVVGAAIGEALARMPGKEVRAVTGFAIGGIPPLGHAAALDVYIDPDLLAHPRVWAAAGTPHTVFEVEPRALATAIGARLLAMS